jgi:tetratricopeptide (TPR) repeat protein
LDVSAAAYYIKNNRLSYQQYLGRIAGFNQNIENSQQALLKEISDYEKTRYGIITSSLGMIIESNKDFQDLLLLVCLLDSQNTPRSLLEFYKSPAVVDSFIHEVKRYSLVTAESPPSPTHLHTFSIHRSTQAIGLDYFVHQLNLKKNPFILMQITKILEEYMADTIDKEDCQKMKVLVIHGETFLQHSFLTPLMKGSISGELGAIYYYLGNYKKAMNCLEISLELYSKSTTEGYRGLARALSYLGILCRNLGENKKAKASLEQAFNIYSTYFPTDYVKIAKTTLFLGDVYRNLGEYEKARDLLKDTLAIYKQHLPENRIDIAWASVYLANVYKELGNYQQAKDLLEQSLSIYKQCLPENHFRTARTLSYLGNVYRKLGYYQKAKDLLEQSFIIYDKQFTKNSIKSVWGLVILGNVHRELGNYKKAIDLLEQSLLIYRENFPEDHIEIAWTSARLGNVYRELKDHQKAKDLVKKSLIIYEKYYGKDHIKTARVLKDLGLVYLEEGQLETAEELLVKALGIFQQSKHSDIYLFLESLAELFLKKSFFERDKGNLQQSQGLKKQAINYLEQALTTVKNHFPEDSPHIVRIEKKLNSIDNKSLGN